MICKKKNRKKSITTYELINIKNALVTDRVIDNRV